MYQLNTLRIKHKIDRMQLKRKILRTKKHKNVTVHRYNNNNNKAKSITMMLKSHFINKIIKRISHFAYSIPFLFIIIILIIIYVLFTTQCDS